MNCDIIIPVWNQHIFTRDCIDSIEASGIKTGYTVIMVDNASDGETRLYLEALGKSKKERVQVLKNEKNLGFVKAANQAIRVSKAPYICILNNDTLVTAGWLDEMVSIAESQKDIGIVNPSSNTLGQRPEKGEAIELYAAGLRPYAGKFIELGAAVGFCMLIKKEVIQRIGLFDEIYGMGNFEDTDFSRRAIKEGYKCVRACGAYVYHRESSSFNKLKTFDADFIRNREIFEFRWGRPRRVAYILDSYNDNALKRLNAESLKLARNGNWVWYFFGKRPDMPAHSNIIPVEIPSKNFYLLVLYRILKKKKRFNEIFVGGDRFGRLLEGFSFLHKAKVNYY